MRATAFHEKVDQRLEDLGLPPNETEIIEWEVYFDVEKVEFFNALPEENAIRLSFSSQDMKIKYELSVWKALVNRYK